MIRHMRVDCKPREEIGEAIARTMNDLAQADYKFKVIAIVPQMLAFFATSPERYETTSVDIIIDTQKG